MAPRTRSRRLERRAIEALVNSGGHVNGYGLPALPPEVLFNVVSHYSCIPIPYTKLPTCIPVRFLERSQSLNTLTQTCQRLRNILLPLQWQKIEVGVQMLRSGDKTYSRRLARELIRQLEIVTVRNPSLATYVREVSIWLQDDHDSANTVFAELGRSLHHFLNLHTLQIIFPGFRYGSDILEAAFEGQVFLHVKRLILTSSFTVDAFFKAFTGVRHYCSSYDRHRGHWRAVLECWGNVTEIEGLAVPDKMILIQTVQKLPHLVSLEIDADVLLRGLQPTDLVSILAPLEELRVVKFTTQQYSCVRDREYLPIKQSASMVVAGFKQSPFLKEVKVMLVFYGGTFKFPGFPSYEEVIEHV